MRNPAMSIHGRSATFRRSLPPRSLQRTTALLAYQHEQRVLKALKLTDRIQLFTFWLAFGVTISMYYSITPTEPLIRGILGVVTFVIGASELWMMYVTKRGILRTRTFLLLALYAWFFAKPLIFGVDSTYGQRLTMKDYFYALAMGFLFAASIWTGYVLRGPKEGIMSRTLGEIVPKVTPSAAFWICIVCLVPELLNRWVHTDWSRVQSLPLAIIGQDAAARFALGRFGDQRSFWRPATYMFEMLGITTTIAFIKCKGRTDLRIILVFIYLFFAVSMSMGWARYKMGMALFTPVIILMCVSPSRKYLWYYVAGAGMVAVYVVLSALMLEGRAGAWYRKGIIETLSEDKDDRAEKTIEDTFSTFANVLKVVPDIEPYKPFYDVYYFIAINPIPRAIWPSKPVIDQEYLGRRRLYYCTVTCAGDAFICGGVLHLIAFSALIGVVSRSVDNLFQPWRPMEPEFALVHLAIAWFLFILVRSIGSAALFGIPLVLFLVFLATVRFIRGRKKRGQTFGTRKLPAPVVRRRRIAAVPN